MPATNLHTLKAKVRERLDHCTLYNTEELPELLRRVQQNKQDGYILTEKLVTEIATLMQRFEEWVLAGKPPSPPHA